MPVGRGRGLLSAQAGRRGGVVLAGDPSAILPSGEDNPERLRGGLVRAHAGEPHARCLIY